MILAASSTLFHLPAAVVVVLAVLWLAAPAARGEVAPSPPVAASQPVAAVRVEHAERLEIDRRRLRASGEVRIVLGLCRLRANEVELTVDPDRGRPLRLCSQQVSIDAPGAWLAAHRLQVDGAGLRARWLDLEICRCGGAPVWPRLRLAARRAWTGAKGRRLHLTWPTVRIGPVPLAAAPYWSVPLRPGTSGLLWPRIGYSSRDGIRLEQGVYLAVDEQADLTVAGGWHQERGPHLRTRVRFAGGNLGRGDVALLAIDDQGQWRAAARGGAVAGARIWQLGLFPDLVTDGALLSDLPVAASRVFAPYLRSRLFGRAAAGPFFAMIAADLFHDIAPQQPFGAAVVQPARAISVGGRDGALHGGVTARVVLAPTSVVGPLALAAEASWTAVSDALLPEVPSSGWLSLIEVSPATVLALAGGPLRLSAAARYRLQVVTRQGDDGVAAGHAGGGSAEIAVPLARSYERLRHALEPFAGWRGLFGDQRWTAAGERLEPRGGGVGLLGLRSRLARRADGRAVVRGQAAVAVGGSGLRLGVVDLQLGRRLRLDLRSTVPLDGGDRGVDFYGALCAGSSRIGRLCGGYLRHRLGLLELISADPDTLAGGWPAVPGPHVLADAHEAAPGVDRIHAEARLRLWSSLRAGAALFFDPVARELTHGSYRLSIALGCGCYRISLLGHSRRGQRWPDLMLRLAIGMDRSLGCLAVR